MDAVADSSESSVEVHPSYVVWQASGLGEIRFEWGRFPSTYGVDECWAGLWTVEVQCVSANVHLFLEAQLAAPDWDGGHNTGQHLIATTYSNATATVSIGTADNDILHARAVGAMEPSLPGHLSEYFGDVDFEYEPKIADNPGIIWKLPPLRAGDIVELHVLAAWTYEPDSVAPWYAVDERIDQVKAVLRGHS